MTKAVLRSRRPAYISSPAGALGPDGHPGEWPLLVVVAPEGCPHQSPGPQKPPERWVAARPPGSEAEALTAPGGPPGLRPSGPRPRGRRGRGSHGQRRPDTRGGRRRWRRRWGRPQTQVEPPRPAWSGRLDPRGPRAGRPVTRGRGPRAPHPVPLAPSLPGRLTWTRPRLHCPNTAAPGGAGRRVCRGRPPPGAGPEPAPPPHGP